MGWLDREIGKSLVSMLFRRGKAFEHVLPGCLFRRIHDDELVETAEVESLGTDAYGIPHVKFKVTFSRPNRFTYDEGSRTLAVRSFAERYRERVTS